MLSTNQEYHPENHIISNVKIVSQERYNMINIIVNENGYTINGKYVQIKAVESKIIKRSIVESIFLEIELYRRLPKIL